ncbi:MAG: hypothetical protein JWM53_371 [bacterium]|nr:hypothetical protein [bacterium]
MVPADTSASGRDSDSPRPVPVDRRRQRIFRLRELFEDPLVIFGRDADAGVRLQRARPATPSCHDAAVRFEQLLVEKGISNYDIAGDDCGGLDTVCAASSAAYCPGGMPTTRLNSRVRWL